MMKKIKILGLVTAVIVLCWLLFDSLSLVVNGQSTMQQAYKVPHTFPEAWAVFPIARDTASLKDCLTNINYSVSIGMTGGEWDIDEDMTINTNHHLFFDCDTVLNVASGVTLTINGSLDSAGDCLMFDGEGTITGDPLNDCLGRHWFGDNLTVTFSEPYCDEYATTNWVIWYVGDHFTNTVQDWTTNWVINYVTNYVGDLTSTNWASLVTNNYFIDGVTNNMETLIVRSNMTVAGYDYTDFVSERIFFGYNASTVSIVGPVTYIDDWDGVYYDPYNSFTLTNGVFIPPKDGYYLLIGNALNTVQTPAENNETDLFFDIDTAGSSKPYGYSTFTDDSAQMGLIHSRIYKLFTTNHVQLAVYEEDANAEWIVQAFFSALYLGE